MDRDKTYNPYDGVSPRSSFLASLPPFPGQLPDCRMPGYFGSMYDEYRPSPSIFPRNLGRTVKDDPRGYQNDIPMSWNETITSNVSGTRNPTSEGYFDQYPAYLPKDLSREAADMSVMTQGMEHRYTNPYSRSVPIGEGSYGPPLSLDKHPMTDTFLQNLVDKEIGKESYDHSVDLSLGQSKNIVKDSSSLNLGQSKNIVKDSSSLKTADLSLDTSKHIMKDSSSLKTADLSLDPSKNVMKDSSSLKTASLSLDQSKYIMKDPSSLKTADLSFDQSKNIMKDPSSLKTADLSLDQSKNIMKDPSSLKSTSLSLDQSKNNIKDSTNVKGINSSLSQDKDGVNDSNNLKTANLSRGQGKNLARYSGSLKKRYGNFSQSDEKHIEADDRTGDRTDDGTVIEREKDKNDDGEEDKSDKIIETDDNSSKNDEQTPSSYTDWPKGVPLLKDIQPSSQSVFPDMDSVKVAKEPDEKGNSQKDDSRKGTEEVIVVEPPPRSSTSSETNTCISKVKERSAKKRHLKSDNVMDALKNVKKPFKVVVVQKPDNGTTKTAGQSSSKGFDIKKYASLLANINPMIKTEPGVTDESSPDKDKQKPTTPPKIKILVVKNFKNKKGRYIKKGKGKVIQRKLLKSKGKPPANKDESDEDETDITEVKEIRVKHSRKHSLCAICGGRDHVALNCTDDKPIAHIYDNDFCENSLISSLATLPSELYLGMSGDREHGLGVFCKTHIQKGTQFGPVIGEDMEFKDIAPDMDFQHIWYAAKDKEWKNLAFMNTRDEMKSNWCRYLRPSSEKTCNLISIAREQQLYFLSRRPIRVGEELVYYTSYFEEVKGGAHSGSKQTLPINRDEGNKKFCTQCKVSFTNCVNYIKHCQIYHTSNMAQLRSQCRLCKESFLTKKELKKHVYAYHDGAGGEFVCAICGNAYVYQTRLNAHMKDTHSVQQVGCDECGKIYLNPGKLAAHKRRAHAKGVYQCEVCSKFFSCDSVLKKHRFIHEEKYTVSCDRCGKLFRDKSNLKVHLLTHSGIKPFLCSEPGCSAAFTVKQCLQGHYRKAHGYHDENMPEITRSVPFTSDAYLGQEDVDEMQLEASLLTNNFSI